MENNNNKEITMDELARMVAKGFNDMGEKMEKIGTDVDGLKKEVKEIKKDTEDIKTELNKKVDKFTHNDLKFRVEKLEKNFA